MYIQVTESMFHEQFYRVDRVNNFSYEARSMLFDYLTEAEDNGENGQAGLELDIIAICCDFVEMSIDDFLRSYDIDISDEEDTKEAITSHIEYNSVLIGWVDDETVLFANF